MDRITALKMNEKVIRFLSKHGNKPAIKEVDDRILKAERRLSNKLTKLQAGVEAQFIKALRERGYLPSNIAEQRGFVGKLFEEPFKDMRTVIADEGIKGALLGRQLTFEDLAKEGLQLTLTTFSEDVTERLWNRTYQFSEDTFSRIEGDFIRTLRHGYDEGLGIDEVATNLRGDFENLRDNRLHTIARTEIQTTQNEGSHQTLKDYNVNYKQWLTVGDGQVRGNNPNDYYDHTVLHGQVVEINEPYSNGMMYPSDRSGDIGDWINCRCRERPYIPKKGKIILTTPYYP